MMGFIGEPDRNDADEAPRCDYVGRCAVNR